MPLDAFLTSRFGPAAALAHTRAAEAAGLGGVWLAEHHFVSYGQCPSATLLAGHLLAATARITIGTAACVLSARHPVALAEEASVLRALGGDRFVLGVARGGPWIEAELLGGGAERYERGFAEALDVLLSRVSGVSPVGADGEFFRFPPLAVVPNVPGVPVMVAVTSGASAELAARRGLPLLLGVQAGDDEVAGVVRRWREVAEAEGHDPDGGGHARVRVAYPAKDRATGERELRAALPAWLAGMGEAVRIAGGTARDPREHVEAMLRHHPVGRPAEVAERLAESAARTGVRRQLCLVEAVPDAAAATDLIASLGALPDR
ncbi:alkanesulfonate monooxygenase SsuD/methylene tetrahydromethanopterin reductase-like flavin-dependent oxidoreductase (luciferase family) [Allocatelliglobosispora scoriae]|uniref:Alkanesulfonate monooxygenase SsuD/methylene tetrahydromethanopterin reductase-like flavin-dependent oxidoreductase (Luciferase family) n=1 Tax=Allocatelliglobosispora scoriae TaxID=643052 RepID=A0A841C504_9ACTN|nr:LLM class flavin-dependent oxidoreductase [Allocatelliglobosispora scoriae]MBB5873901.1 alkanesulfonate monooxygenase SsuD/methylene tetrahydromethanopterin reductase-like flavin-dependent oxidoreductase (luciferase family) [Allocatelliglobosispora scoriae]